MYDFITCIGHWEDTGLYILSYADFPSVGTFHFTIKKSYLLILPPISSGKSIKPKGEEKVFQNSNFFA